MFSSRNRHPYLGSMGDDPVRDDFLRHTFAEARSLSAASDRFELITPEEDPPNQCLLHFHCGGLRLNGDREIVEADEHVVGVTFPSDYLRGPINTFLMFSWLGPARPFHPNIHPAAPLICVGPVDPGTDLVGLIHRLFEIITFQRYATDDFINAEAGEWVRRHRDRLPIDARPLRRPRSTSIPMTPGTSGGDA